jgi:hypothetical protein
MMRGIGRAGARRGRHGAGAARGYSELPPVFHRPQKFCGKLANPNVLMGLGGSPLES